MTDEMNSSVNETEAPEGNQESQELNVAEELAKLRSANRTLVEDLSKLRKFVKGYEEKVTTKKSDSFDEDSVIEKLYSRMQYDNLLGDLDEDLRDEVEQVREDLGYLAATKVIKKLKGLAGREPKPHVPAGNAKKTQGHVEYDKNAVMRLPPDEKREVLKAIKEGRASYKKD